MEREEFVKRPVKVTARFEIRKGKGSSYTAVRKVPHTENDGKKGWKREVYQKQGDLADYGTVEIRMPLVGPLLGLPRRYDRYNN